jgi:CubicO group peptidase (beta-lactamase class C family)
MTTPTKLLSIATLVASSLTLVAAAGSVPAGYPEEAGFSTERLGRIREAVQRHITAGQVPGVVTLVSRRGKVVHFETHGMNDVEAKKPMPKDAIFRLASMSKPIGAVAVMMMVEEGKVRLNDPVSRFIPEFKQASLAVPKGGAAPASRGRGGPPPEVDLVPTRAITVRDLLTHTSGLMSGGPGQQTAPPGTQRTPQDTLASYVPREDGDHHHDADVDAAAAARLRERGNASYDRLASRDTPRQPPSPAASAPKPRPVRRSLGGGG